MWLTDYLSKRGVRVWFMVQVSCVLFLLLTYFCALRPALPKTIIRMLIRTKVGTNKYWGKFSIKVWVAGGNKPAEASTSGGTIMLIS